ncbi:MAG TPA: helix-turn-helix domain-containing protein [Acidimicrobiales bacterium]|nr:helix-turn-helix domain-containing protein [Acidimicrobiales bacterium]
MARTQEQRKAATRAGLLDAAADQFARKGFHAVSTEAIADAADRTTGALYAHFGNKEGLLFALVDDYRVATADAVTTSVPDPGDLDGIIAAAWDHIVASDDPGSPWLLLEMELWLHGARDDSIGRQLAERYAHIRGDLADGLAAWAHAHDTKLVAPAPELATRALSFLLGAALQHRLDPASVTSSEVIDAVHLLVTDPRRHP